jgi:hypothetical protein
MARPIEWDTTGIETDLDAGKTITQIAKERNISRPAVSAWVIKYIKKITTHERLDNK